MHKKDYKVGNKRKKRKQRLKKELERKIDKYSQKSLHFGVSISNCAFIVVVIVVTIFMWNN